MSHNRRSSNLGIHETGAVSGEACHLCHRVRLLERDHDHRTDMCRGWLCHGCNVLLGRLDRPIAEIQRFLDYLKHWSDVHATVGGSSYTEYAASHPVQRTRRRKAYAVALRRTA